MRKLSFVLLMLLVSVAFGCISTKGCIVAKGKESKGLWPAIQPMKRSHLFVNHHDMRDQLEIVGIDGTPLYALDCYLNGRDLHPRNVGFDYYPGDFECRLTSLYSKDRYTTLLQENEKSIGAWQSQRGVFLVEELSGKCAEYPEYAKVRHFRLRGMNLTLEVKDFQIEPGSRANAPWDGDRIKELELEVTVTSDPVAVSEIAEPTKYAEPLVDNGCKSSWPVVQPIRKDYHLVDHMGVKLQIVSLDGTPLYLLECPLNPEDDPYPDFDTSFNYSGFFQCRLTSLQSIRYDDLLIEDMNMTTDWATRGRFLADELSGKCADYPEYGRVRHFRLRGMELTLEIKDFHIEPNGDGIKELDFEVTVTPDPTAISEIAEPTKYVYPPLAHPEDLNDTSRNCERVLVK